MVASAGDLRGGRDARGERANGATLDVICAKLDGQWPTGCNLRHIVLSLCSSPEVRYVTIGTGPRMVVSGPKKNPKNLVK